MGDRNNSVEYRNIFFLSHPSVSARRRQEIRYHPTTIPRLMHTTICMKYDQLIDIMTRDREIIEKALSVTDSNISNLKKDCSFVDLN